VEHKTWPDLISPSRRLASGHVSIVAGVASMLGIVARL
jgi:hypothetical protein